MALWSGRVATPLDPEVWGFLDAEDALPLP